MTRPALLAEAVLWSLRAIAAQLSASVSRAVAPRIVSEERGATMVEYGMMIALIAIMVMGALFLLGGSVSVKLTQIASCLSTRVCT